MLRNIVCLAAAGAALSLAACGNDAKSEAAQDVRELLVAAQAGDAAGFEAGIDRTKLKANLRSQLREHAQPQGIDLEPSEAALERMIGPDALRVARTAGEPLTAEEIATALKVEEGSLACFQATDDACALTFEKQGERWKLINVRTSAIDAQAG